MTSSISPHFSAFRGITKCTLAITQNCNLACDYCYIQKKKAVMSASTARRAVDFVFANTPEDEKIEFGLFGGEPLLEFGLVKEITSVIQDHECFDPRRAQISVTTNGTIFSDEIADFLVENNVALCISCDGPSEIQDASRRFRNGKGSSSVVEENIKKALAVFPLTPVNAVYSPESLHSLPIVFDYLASLGVKNVYLSPNISALWTMKDLDMLPKAYDAVGEKYVGYYSRGEPKHVNIIDGKITLILCGGYKPHERCRMGTAEFAFAPSGNIYPCERLIGADDGKTHCIGNVNQKSPIRKNCSAISTAAINTECKTCGLADYCMNWCGCTNFHSTGSYSLASPFTCASEKAAINTAFRIIKKMGDNWSNLQHHLSGTPLMNIVGAVLKERERLNNHSGTPL